MSFCYNSKSPIDLIEIETASIPCTDKCLYQYNYNKSSLIGKNLKTHLEFTLKNNDKSTINFGGNLYNLEKIMLFRNSAHRLNGKVKHAELILEHSKIINPSKKLVVCILINSVANSDSDLDFIIEKMSLLNPNLNNEATIMYPSFSLNNIIPREKFFTYQANLFYNKTNSGLCDKINTFIVFDKMININNKNYNNLISLIDLTIFRLQTVNKPPTFYSGSKASIGTGVIGDDDIYIECKPTGDGDSTMVQEIVEIKEENKYKYLTDFLKKTFGKLYGNREEIFSSIIGAILIYAVLKVLKKFRPNNQ